MMMIRKHNTTHTQTYAHPTSHAPHQMCVEAPPHTLRVRVLSLCVCGAAGLCVCVCCVCFYCVVVVVFVVISTSLDGSDGVLRLELCSSFLLLGRGRVPR